jgi:hypothetical protein
MPEIKISDMQLQLATRSLPTITMWNRLEGRTRTHDFNAVLKAAIRDPLWMLTKQWQVGEFKADDAGSPVFAKINMSTSRLEGYQAGKNAAQTFDYGVPLEAQVEQRMIPFEREEQAIALDIRLLMGRHWLKLIKSLGDFREQYISAYPIAAPDPTALDDAMLCAHAETWQHVSAVAGRAMDGYKLYAHLKAGGSAANGTGIPATDHVALDERAARFVAWFKALYYQPDDGANDAWQADYLEYQFSISAPDAVGSDVLHAEEYYHGRLDWYNLDIDSTRSALDAPPATPPEAELPRATQSFIPAPLSYEGMPDNRWWAFEDSRSNFGDVNPGTKDLSKLMLIEFSLIYANDWFLFPLTLPIGTTTRINGLAVTNVFGERTWIEPAGRGRDSDWERWNMYTLATAGAEGVQADMRFVLLPGTAKIQQAAPIEEVKLIRDEMANMVWGIEARVPLPHGRSRPGYEAAVDLRRYLERFYARLPSMENPLAPPPAIALRYTMMSNNVPENWIPFVPVHVPGDNRQIQLQRAALPRIITGDPKPPTKIRPRTGLLGEGRATDDAYYLHEEEVPRAGVDVTQVFRRARWHNGHTLTWLGVRKGIGRGEGSSNLRFDYLAKEKRSE